MRYMFMSSSVLFSYGAESMKSSIELFQISLMSASGAFSYSCLYLHMLSSLPSPVDSIARSGPHKGFPGPERGGSGIHFPGPGFVVGARGYQISESFF